MEKLKSIHAMLCVAFAMLLSSCINSISDEDAESVPTCRLTINVGQLVSEIPMPSTRAAITLADNTKAITVWAVGEDGQVKQSVNQSSTEPGYGSISMELPAADYTIVAVAHNGAQAAYASGIISFADNKVTDTFIGKADVSISSTTPQSTSITLRRRVAKLTVRMDDALPTNVKQAKATISGYSPKFDLNNDRGTAAEELVRTIDLTGRDGQTAISVTIYTFVPSDPHTTSLTYTVTNTSDAVLYNGTFPSLSLVECTQTLVFGTFFAYNNVWTLDLIGDWNTPIDYDINS